MVNWKKRLQSFFFFLIKREGGRESWLVSQLQCLELSHGEGERKRKIYAYCSESKSELTQNLVSTLDMHLMTALMFYIFWQRLIWMLKYCNTTSRTQERTSWIKGTNFKEKGSELREQRERNQKKTKGTNLWNQGGKLVTHKTLINK